MDGGDISRRDFLRYSAVATTAALAPSISAAEEPKVEVKERRVLRVLLRDPQGKPLPETIVKTMIARDLAGDPLPQTIRNLEGESHIVLPDEPIQLCCQLNVPNFGQVYCYADNDGAGYAKPEKIEFAVDAAKTRLLRVQKKLGADGAGKDDAKVQEYVSEAKNNSNAYQALAAGLHAGERAVLISAQRRIAKLPEPRKEFLFGGLMSGKDKSPDFPSRFQAAFNFATISWYTWKPQPSETDPVDYPRMDSSLQWCLDRKITPKGFGYVYLSRGAMPTWLQSWPYEKMLPVYKRVVEQTMRRYAGRLPFAEIINEAHDKSNLPRFNHEQILELTREACAAARRGSADVKRQINNCCLWAEYARTRNKDGSRRWSPYRYIADCVKSNVEFERIGLQLYYPTQDLLEIERMLDRFKDFGRPLHISEISCNSKPGLDLDSMRPKEDVPGWHGPWTETMQADWLEAIYTLCYSKPEFEAVGWWDIADYGGHFWPHGGLFHKDFTPKESYLRLLTLKKTWNL